MRRSQNFDFLDLKNLSRGQFWGAPTNADIIEFLNFLLQLWEENCVWIFYYFNFERSYDVLKSKSSCIKLNKNINFNKNGMESKMENLTHSFREMNLVLQLM